MRKEIRGERGKCKGKQRGDGSCPAFAWGRKVKRVRLTSLHSCSRSKWAGATWGLCHVRNEAMHWA